MSRIDEALKRVSDDRRDRHQPEAGPVGSIRTVDVLLEEYPEETPARAERAEAVTRPRSAVAAPRAMQVTRPLRFDASVTGKLIGAGETPTVCVEQYRRLAASVHEVQVESGLKTLMVTSTLPREGKTLTISNLALTLSESYTRRVLLIDADMRRPSIHEVFNLPNATGLSELLRSDRRELPLFEVTRLLSVLPAGHPDSNPTAGLTSERMSTLLEESAKSFDWILVDAPPVTLLPDAHLLARLTRAVIFVIGAGSTPYPLVERAIADVGRESIVGTVLNRISDQNIPATEYYSEYHAAATSDR